MKGVNRAGSGEMSRGRDVAEGTLPLRTVLFEMTARPTLETSVMVGDPGVDRSLPSKRSGSFCGVSTASSRRGWAGDGVWARMGFSCCRKDRRNHLSESRKIEGRESGASTKWRGYGVRTLRQSGDRWCGINLVDGVGGRGNDGGIGEFIGDPSILV